MSLAQMIRRVAGGKRPRMSEEDRQDMEDEDRVPDGEDNDPETEAETDAPDKDAEDDDLQPDDDSEPEATDEETDKGMSKAEKTAFAKGRRAERARIGSILGSSQADSNPALAAHLAFKTADSPRKALAALKAGGPSASSAGLSARMRGLGASRTGRGGEADSRHSDSASAWDGALAKAGVKIKGK